MQSQDTRRHEWPRADWRGRLDAEPGSEWYACYTRARHEKRVATMLRDRDLEGYLPVVGQKRSWHDRKKTVDFPLFPGYVFVRIARSQMYEVTSIPSVVTLVTVDGVPAAISDEEIENIRRFTVGLTEAGERVEAEPLIREGEHVIVTAGPFRDVRGVVVEGRGRGRVLVGLPALGQGFSINVQSGQLQVVESD